MKSIVILWLFLLITPSLYAQLTICGTVTDAQTGETLPGVNVYLANTTLGASTDSQGAYTLSNLPSGTYVLVFSFVGYQTKAFELNIKNASATRRIDQALQPHSVEMSELRVEDSNKKWRKNFKNFRRAFIGQTPFAKETTIENPWIIDFSTDPDVLRATARKPLTIINKALGYKLHAELVEFEWSRSKDTGIYKIYPRYEPLKAVSKAEAQRWRRNRMETYLGSFQHYLKSMYSETVDRNNFSVFSHHDLAAMTIGEMRYELMQRDGVAYAMRNTIKGYTIKQRVRISYRNTRRFQTNDGGFKVSVRKKAAIEANTESGIFMVHKNGKLLDPASLILFGNWGRTRLADTLPDNYEIGN